MAKFQYDYLEPEVSQTVVGIQLQRLTVDFEQQVVSVFALFITESGAKLSRTLPIDIARLDQFIAQAGTLTGDNFEQKLLDGLVKLLPELPIGGGFTDLDGG